MGVPRIAADLGAGAGIAGGYGSIRNQSGLLPVLLGGTLIGLVVGAVFTFVISLLLPDWAFPGPVGAGTRSRERRRYAARCLIVLLLAGGAVAGLALWLTGPHGTWAGTVHVAVAALPAAFVLVSGAWVCRLAWRRTRASRYRWVRYIPDLLVAALTGIGLLVLFRLAPLSLQPAAGLLFPVGAWAAIRVWLAMARSGRLAVRAGADIALSLLLGADLVLLLVWAANLLGLPEVEVAALRGALERAGAAADLPWWLWAGLYVLLAGAALAFVRWPGRLEEVTRWFGRLRVVPSVGVSRRVLTGVHIGLLVAVLIGVAAPPPLAATLRGQLKAAYTLALQRELDADGEQAAYREVHSRFSTAPPPVRPLAAIVSKIHSIGGPPQGGTGATRIERDLARRTGVLQAATLRKPPPSLRSAEPAGARLARFDPPIRGSRDLRERLDRLDSQRQRDDNASRQVDRAAELAAAAVASTIQIPGLGDHEIVQVVREYLSGLVEGSSLKEVFAAWATRLVGRGTPPRPDQMVVPNPGRLQRAAFTAEETERRSVLVADPFTVPRVSVREGSEPPADAAVDLINEVRYFQERSGPCAGCPRLLPPGENPFEAPGDHPGEDEEPPDVPVR